MDIRPATTPDEIPAVRDLFREYAAALGISLCFQHFDEELAGLPGAYAPPTGRLLVAADGPALAGCIALRPLGEGACEMKRLYVRPAYRKTGLGRRLVDRILAEAEAAGYHEIRLDTLPVMADAIRLYRALGFTDTEPYYDNPVPGALFLRKPLRP
ncbi:MAG TPA: GNAT family N-acetyltransferase [Gemmataceae bacterium]|nr:GNAT family N-acetyltransferase [Gemmataceae bacterium]